MKKAYVLHHLGLGDHIACNSLYRSLAKKYDQLVLPVKEHNYDSLQRMLSDVDNISMKCLSNKNPAPEKDMIVYAELFFKMATIKYGNASCDIIKLGHYGENFHLSDNCRFDEVFYDQASIPFIKSWTDFVVPRNLNTEKEVFNLLCGTGMEGKYIFLHEDPSRKDVIRRSLINSDLPIITPGLHRQHALGDTNEINFFDYRYILENAKEIHCIESSFSIFADRIPLRSQKHLHRYTRYDQAPPTLKNNWTIHE